MAKVYDLVMKNVKFMKLWNCCFLVLSGLCVQVIAVTKEQCADNIEQYRSSLLTASVMGFLSQPGNYGVWQIHTTNFLILNAGQVLSSLAYDFAAPANFLLGHGLQIGISNMFIPGISTGKENLVCHSHGYDGFEPVDICCFYDEENIPNRKRKRSEDDEPDDEEPGKKQFFQDQGMDAWADDPDALFYEFDSPNFRVGH